MAVDRRADAAAALADAFLTGTWHLRSLMARGDLALSAGGRWLREVAFDVVQRWPEAPRDEQLVLRAFINEHAAFKRAWSRREIPRVPFTFRALSPKMRPRRWPVRQLDSVADLSAWLGLGTTRLSWFADTKGLERDARDEPLRHYRRRWVDRGERLPRLLEAPKDHLKAVQRALLREVLGPIPAHPAAHGFVPGRSVVTHAALHTGKALVVRFDLEAFFTNVATWRALGVFLAAGYPQSVATALLGLCTTRTPERVLQQAPAPAGLSTERFFLQRRLAEWHLPQGAPTSPALANLAAWQLDVRLEGVARQRGFTYSRYADDLVFSGDEPNAVGPLTALVSLIAKDEGFRINPHKTQVMRAHEQQRVCGVVVNARPNVARAEFDELKALLHRCSKKGPVSQATGPLEDFASTLQGRISWVAQLNPARGARLQREFDGRISWVAQLNPARGARLQREFDALEFVPS